MPPAAFCHRDTRAVRFWVPNGLQRVATDAGRKPGTHAATLPGAQHASRLRDEAPARSALLLAVLAHMPIVLPVTCLLLASGAPVRRK